MYQFDPDKLINFLEEYCDGLYVDLYYDMIDKLKFEWQKELQNGAFYEYDHILNLYLTDLQFVHVDNFIKYLRHTDYTNDMADNLIVDTCSKKLIFLFRDNKPVFYDDEDYIRIIIMILEYFQIRS